MNLKDAAERPLKESLKKQNPQSTLQVLAQAWLSIQPELKAAYLRLQLRNPLLIPALLENYSSDYLAEYLAEILAPPATPEEAKVHLLADLVVSLQYPEKKLIAVISKARLEIGKAYNAVMRDGGGWSSKKSNPDKRMTAVLAWYKENESSLSYLNENNLNNHILYRDGGQHKRDFRVRLLLEIIKDIGNKELTFRKIHADYFKGFKGPIKPLRIEDLES